MFLSVYLVISCVLVVMWNLSFFVFIKVFVFYDLFIFGRSFDYKDLDLLCWYIVGIE